MLTANPPNCYTFKRQSYPHLTCNWPSRSQNTICAYLATRGICTAAHCWRAQPQIVPLAHNCYQSHLGHLKENAFYISLSAFLKNLMPEAMAFHFEVKPFSQSMLGAPTQTKWVDWGWPHWFLCTVKLPRTSGQKPQPAGQITPAAHFCRVLLEHSHTIRLSTVHGCFCNTTAELQSRERFSLQGLNYYHQAFDSPSLLTML